MKKPTGKNTKQDTKKNIKKEDEEPQLFIVVDSNDTYQDDLTQFYIHPKRISLIKNLNDKIAEGAVIRNTNVEHLTSMNLHYVLKKMKVDAPLEVFIHQPLNVMQSYDAKQIEANAKLAGYDKIETSEAEIEVKRGETTTTVKTLVVTAVRPEKNPNQLEIEVEQTITKKGGNIVDKSTNMKLKGK